MANKKDLQGWMVDALRANGGRASIVEICEFVWANHEGDLRASGSLFYTWQYDIRRAATRLRGEALEPASSSPSGIWELS